MENFTVNPFTVKENFTVKTVNPKNFGYTIIKKPLLMSKSNHVENK